MSLSCFLHSALKTQTDRRATYWPMATPVVQPQYYNIAGRLMPWLRFKNSKSYTTLYSVGEVAFVGGGAIDND